MSAKVTILVHLYAVKDLGPGWLQEAERQMERFAKLAAVAALLWRFASGRSQRILMPAGRR